MEIRKSLLALMPFTKAEVAHAILLMDAPEREYPQANSVEAKPLNRRKGASSNFEFRVSIFDLRVSRYQAYERLR
jgi:hypothetical protein